MKKSDQFHKWVKWSSGRRPPPRDPCRSTREAMIWLPISKIPCRLPTCCFIWCIRIKGALTRCPQPNAKPCVNSCCCGCRTIIASSTIQPSRQRSPITGPPNQSHSIVERRCRTIGSTGSAGHAVSEIGAGWPRPGELDRSLPGK